MITFSKLGKKGRLGNQLFQIAALYGLADKHKHSINLKPWKYSKYFNGSFPEITGYIPPCQPIPEKNFEYTPDYYTEKLKPGNWDLDGYFQSPKYWENYPHIKALFSFNEGIINFCQEKYKEPLAKECIAISIRRGDYVDNPNYELLPVTYYFTALQKYFPKWREQNIIIFSDEPEYCKEHFGCFPNVYFADNFFNNQNKATYFDVNESAIEQLCLMSLCQHFIISNSTFAWWGAYLGEKKKSIIVRPALCYKGDLKKKCDIKDHYPEHWIPYDHTGAIIDLSDVTFTIPVSFDHNDRKQNLELNVCLLQQSFKTNILIGEQGSHKFEYMGQYCDYRKFSELNVFHRTRMLNEMAMIAETPIIANWDADVTISPLMIWDAVDRIRSGADCVYPYDGRFARVPRGPWFPKIEKSLDIGIFAKTTFSGTSFEKDKMSVGGAVLFNKDRFFEGGGENETFITYGPEDAERFERFTKIGFRVERVKGILYHIDHFCGINSSTKHKYIDINRSEWHKVKEMSKEELLAYIKTWEWIKIVN